MNNKVIEQKLTELLVFKGSEKKVVNILGNDDKNNVRKEKIIE